MTINRDDVIRLAREAGINLTPSQFSGVLEDEVDEFKLERFAALVVAAEREACAQVLDAMAAEAEADLDPSSVVAYYRDRAAAIRARGKA